MNTALRVASSMQRETVHEVPAFFPAGGETLFGVLTRSAGQSRGTGIVFVAGGWFSTSIGINRLLVTYSRALASEGYPCMRFDYHGVGESSGEVDRFVLSSPFGEDVQGAVSWMAEQGVDDFILVGICIGGRAVLECASKLTGLKGVCLISVLVHDVGGGRGSKVVRLARSAHLRDVLRRAKNPWLLRNLLKPKVRRMMWTFIKHQLIRIKGAFQRSRPGDEGAGRSVESPIVLEGLQELNERRVPVLMIQGTADADHEGVQQALTGRLGRILHSKDTRIRIVSIPGSIHGFTRVEAQRRVLETISSWIQEL